MHGILSYLKNQSLPRALCCFGVILGLNSIVPHARASTADEDLFIDHVYPVLRAAQCDLCHNDNGVASAYGIEFPSRAASREQILAFGYRLRTYIDTRDISQSLLIRKPTNREEHTGGLRIEVGSEQERLLLDWANYLARLNPEEQRRAEELLQRASQWELQPLSIRRLTHSQYNNTVRDLLGDQSQPANRFPKEDYIHGFKNQLEAQGISPLQAESYSEAAERLAKSAFRGGDLRQLLSIQPKTPTDSEAAKAFIERFGMRAYRRPLLDTEKEKYHSMLLHAAARDDHFFAGATTVVEAMLQSPYFLFQIDRQADPVQRSFTMASRLSYLLWDTMPDDQMLHLATQGELTSREQIAAQARRMLESPLAVQSLDEFLGQWLRFDSVLGATRDRRRFREFNLEMATAMTEETKTLFRHLVWNDLNFMEFFTANYTFLSSNLAAVYGLPNPDQEFARVEYPEEFGRSGVLGHASFLVATSKPAETSPTSRGLFIRNQFLAQEIAPPPPGVNAVLPELTEDKPMTNRERLEIHLNSDACSNCHRLIDPIGLGFEQYDAIGRYHPKMQLRFGGRENSKPQELPLDTRAHIQGIQDSEFSRPKELGKLLASNETCQRCIVKQYFRYAFGREETASDQPMIEEAFLRFRDSGFRFRELILAVVTSELFMQ